MHVISGRFKGVPLTSARSETRPTTDRTKEAIFSRLDSWGVLEGARVLDLFAGTGALGIEALSRGAVELVAVESSKPAAALIARTLGALQRNKAWEAGMSAQVVTRKAESYVGSLQPKGHADPMGAVVLSDMPRLTRAFNLIFIDPPYAFATEECDRLLADLVAGGLAVGPGRRGQADGDGIAETADTVIVLERSTRSQEPIPPEGWRVIERRNYGETAVYYIDGRMASV